MGEIWLRYEGSVLLKRVRMVVWQSFASILGLSEEVSREVAAIRVSDCPRSYAKRSVECFAGRFPDSSQSISSLRESLRKTLWAVCASGVSRKSTFSLAIVCSVLKVRRLKGVPGMIPRRRNRRRDYYHDYVYHDFYPKSQPIL